MISIFFEYFAVIEVHFVSGASASPVSTQQSILLEALLLGCMLTSQSKDFFCKSISILLFRSLCFLFLSFLFLVLSPSFQERRKFYLERVVIELRNWQWIVPLNVTSFLCVTLAGLVRISKIGYLRKDLPSLNSLPVSLIN